MKLILKENEDKFTKIHAIEIISEKRAQELSLARDSMEKLVEENSALKS